MGIKGETENSPESHWKAPISGNMGVALLLRFILFFWESRLRNLGPEMTWCTHANPIPMTFLDFYFESLYRMEVEKICCFPYLPQVRIWIKIIRTFHSMSQARTFSLLPKIVIAVIATADSACHGCLQYLCLLMWSPCFQRLNLL